MCYLNTYKYAGCDHIVMEQLTRCDHHNAETERAAAAGVEVNPMAFCALNTLHSRTLRALGLTCLRCQGIHEDQLEVENHPVRGAPRAPTPPREELREPTPPPEEPVVVTPTMARRRRDWMAWKKRRNTPAWRAREWTRRIVHRRGAYLHR